MTVQAILHRIAAGEPQAFAELVDLYQRPDRSVRYIKRVIGLPGDHIQFKDRKIYVNGQALQRTAAASSEGAVTESIGERQWQVQWREPVATTPTARPTATIPPLNRAETAPVKDLQLTVPDGQVFVLGDNRQSSIDSRNFGTVPMQDILGRARQVWFSSDEHGVRWGRLGQVLE